MNLRSRSFLAGLALGAVLVSGAPSLVEAAPAKDRAPSLRSAPSVWSPLSVVGEVWGTVWGWVAEATGTGIPPGEEDGSSGGPPVPPDPDGKGDKGSGIDPDGTP